MLVVLISCVAKKKKVPSPANEMYVSPLFKGAYRYAQKLGADKIFILSAKYGLLEEDDIIEPYNETLNDKTQEDVKKWAISVIQKLNTHSDIQNDFFVLLAGERYRKYLLSDLNNCSIPLKGMPIGKQLAFYKENNNV
ncbi:MAG TPA: hypothetical protein PLD68_00415 [Clostridiales bacterium]|nr:hypothetical protein [Clostridiales bacterium]